VQALLVTANLVTAANGSGEAQPVEQQQPFDEAVQLLTAELTAQQKASIDAQVGVVCALLLLDIIVYLSVGIQQRKVRPMLLLIVVSATMYEYCCTMDGERCSIR
jgi:hypothetical protein